ncbi:sugar ABC transporter ATP-binding protein [Faecalispora anaeroviscerum]|uniref:sugar ABC transporter ATP-binding protein n=1 Tax=Faecalispora anaeroviscerum TaxID=2991836 RepID=UPI0024BB05BC|nr:sugar ABC transporter ATP-binding protein [Faecalispora anaeroviscerum]
MAQSQTERSGQSLLSVRGICKMFSLNQVLKGINLEIHSGEILALIGGNGAGKSTLMKIIMGIYQPDQGEIEIRGEKVLLTKPSVALTHGIYMVPQEPMLFPNMTVEENILVGVGFDAPSAELRRRLTQLMDDIGWHLDLTRKASSLSIAEQQLVEILRGLLRNAELLIFDEPTSALTFDEVESLFRCIRDLQKKGIGMIYITHRLTEVFDIATHVAIMCDGVITLHGPIGDFTREMLVKGLLPPNMQEQEIKETASAAALNYKDAKPVLELVNYSGYGFRGINLKIYPGEILGVAGVVGAGRTELATTIFGRDKVLGGQAILDGKNITGLSTKKVLEAGVNYVPEDRHLNGLFKISDVAANTTSAILNRMVMGKVFLNRKTEQELTQEYIEHFRIKATGQDQLTGSLSGGNQQKVVIARALSTKPKLVILDEPTRGIDAVARGEVYSIIHQLKEQGVAVMLISSDMEEIVELSDRAVTVYQGRINGEFSKEEINQDNLMAAAFDVISREQVVS